ncbi:hypodermin-A-like [Drosophila subpulchrella]|uniref:hypodermin-A-like n=1 Tax=Drosophila subpulchrella TaxID=1486046 RepID=UPI0018A17271|nr:hypodermin-A-like [Drosophila subpulchrella]
MLLKALPLLLGLFLLVLSDPDPEPAVYDDAEEEMVKCNNRTLGGTPVDINTAPWTASISITEKAKCAGIVYNWNHVLTAAKCVDGFMNKAIKVRLGSTDRSTGVTEVAVCKIIVHENPIKPSKTIKNIQVINKLPADGTKTVSHGWASFRWWAMFWTKCVDELAHKMLKAEVKFYNHNKCLGLWPQTSFARDTNPNAKITEDLFCTNKVGNESCSFDMGAP